MAGELKKPDNEELVVRTEETVATTIIKLYQKDRQIPWKSFEASLLDCGEEERLVGNKTEVEFLKS